VPRSLIRRRIDHHLRILVDEIGARPPGSPANRRAMDHARHVLADAGLDTRLFPFSTRWWEPGTGRLTTPERTVEVTPNPYSPPCDVTGEVVHVGTLADLDAVGEVAARVVVLNGGLTLEPVMPKGFPFYNPDQHRHLVAALEAARPAAVLAVSEQWQPIFEDADLSFPSATVRPPTVEGLHDGTRLRVELGGRVHEGLGATVSGSTTTGRRIVLSAHLDSKVTTPGAFDNAGSVAVLLTLAELDLLGDAPVELVLFNGEDHFDACGELAWLAETDLAEVLANLNLDGVGVIGRGTTLAALSCPPHLSAALAGFTGGHPGWSPTAPWMESDHAVFAMQGIPAVAVTSEDIHSLLADLAHGPRDTLAIVDTATLAQVTLDLRDLLAVVAGELQATAG
jgi:aminopeptidase YwaD